MKIWDISPIISPDTAVFPGDQPYTRETSLAFSLGHHLTLSAIKTTLHLGAHADATVHYHPKGEGIDRRDLRSYLGRCQVLEVNLPLGERVMPHHLRDPIAAERVLIRTGSFPDPQLWNDDFNSLSPELIHQLHQQGVMLVGIDTPSVDPSSSKALESHQALFLTGMAVLEGLILEQVPAGIYTLVALPLRLKDADASPVRAILLEEKISRSLEE